MVKKAEKLKKRSPWVPVFGLITAVALGAVAYVISAYVVIKMPQVKSVIAGMERQATIAFAVGIWLALLATAFFLVALIVGKDPESAKDIPLPPKAKDKPKGYRK
jgi:hypothetical protein